MAIISHRSTVGSITARIVDEPDIHCTRNDVVTHAKDVRPEGAESSYLGRFSLKRM